jgi:hypothetical protein
MDIFLSFNVQFLTKERSEKFPSPKSQIPENPESQIPENPEKLKSWKS